MNAFNTNALATAGTLSRDIYAVFAEMQIPVLRPEDLKAQEEADARQARIIGLNTAMALLNGAGGVKKVSPFFVAGSIINMASVAGLKGISAIPAYTAAEAGIIGMTRSIAVHCQEAKNRIRVNAIAPGGIVTPMTAQALAELPADHAGLDVAMRVVALSSLVAAVFFFLGARCYAADRRAAEHSVAGAGT